MSISGMYMLNTEEYSQEKIHLALETLYLDRKNQFRELSEVLLPENAINTMPTWREFVLNFSLDVECAFEAWSDQIPLTTNSPQKALTILRRLSRDKTSMNQLVHLLNMAYDISTEFKEIYKRLK
ncbi:MAG: hypothetical protein HOE93_02615 [Nitrosopumilus sp.]|nr:hypothetical protein [Nitrosopumilus sp.]MBT3573837.1 hypothetical protein [Nitrosopumilus sp.]MBT3861290.1 hypothetical protein [Nitrosopumilus sp.]MBT3956189.1 hypothetical protein [Nitrosopumilus sp.]MBT4298581.1 hypothetical protein [Nitrosopumilus sp.]